MKSVRQKYSRGASHLREQSLPYAIVMPYGAVERTPLLVPRVREPKIAMGQQQSAPELVYRPFAQRTSLTAIADFVSTAVQ